MSVERCKSPLNPKCGSTDIAVYIMYGGAKLPVCSRCWEQIAESDMEWGEGVSAEKRRRQVEEAKRRMLEDARRRALEELADRAVRRLKRLKP